MAGTGILPPLFERLASSEVDTVQVFDRQGLLDSVRTELLRLFNTRRGPHPVSYTHLTLPTILLV